MTMISIGNYVADITITLQDGEIAELLGIGDDQLDAAYDAIDWDGIENELTGLARALVAKQKVAVKATLGIDSEVDEGDEACNVDGSDENQRTSVWCRFGVVPAGAKSGDHTWQYPSLDVDDISVALDGFPIDELPKWGDDFSHVDYKTFLAGLIAALKQHGIIDGDAWEVIEFDGIDESAYEGYYDTRLRHEGRLSIERR